jgi:hypothetical protein
VVETLCRDLVQPCFRSQAGVRWRTAAEGLPPAARMISALYDLYAHDAKQDTTAWLGDMGHFTESSEPERPHLITPGETTAGPGAGAAVPHAIHEWLQAQQLLACLHSVDTGNLDADFVINRQRDYGSEWLGPTRPADPWQAQKDRGADARHCAIDWAQHRPSVRWGR